MPDGEFELKTKITVPAECEVVSKFFTENDWKALVTANEEISKRDKYGVRKEKANERGTVAVWSNGGKEWICYTEPVEEGTELTLDANMIFLPVSPERCRRIRKCMIDLPLYHWSTEAQVRGETSWQEAGKQWALRQLERIAEESYRD